MIFVNTLPTLGPKRDNMIMMMKETIRRINAIVKTDFRVFFFTVRTSNFACAE